MLGPNPVGPSQKIQPSRSGAPPAPSISSARLTRSVPAPTEAHSLAQPAGFSPAAHLMLQPTAQHVIQAPFLTRPLQASTWPNVAVGPAKSISQQEAHSPSKIKKEKSQKNTIFSEYNAKTETSQEPYFCPKMYIKMTIHSSPIFLPKSTFLN